MNRKERRAARAKAFDRTPHKRGRKLGVPGIKIGATPLRRSEMGPEVAVFGMLVRTRLRGSPIHAAEFAASVFNKSVVVTRIDGGLCFDYTGGLGEIVNRVGPIVTKHRQHDPELRDDARKNRRDKILREAPKLIAGATGEDRVWLEVSMQALDGAFNALALGDDKAMQLALTILKSIGWRATLKKSFLKSTKNHSLGRINLVDQ
jgi:hypothetical protein